MQLFNQTLGSSHLSTLVQLPPDEDLSEWISVNCFDFYTHVNLLFGCVRDNCTDTSCPIMNAGPQWEFYWDDGSKFKRPTKLSAPEYINNLMAWIKSQIDDESIFPTTMGVPFKKDFIGIVKVILKRLSRVYGHLYYVHFQIFLDLGLDVLLNTSFKHFVHFIREFDLISPKDLLPLASLLEKID